MTYRYVTFSSKKYNETVSEEVKKIKINLSISELFLGYFFVLLEFLIRWELLRMYCILRIKRNSNNIVRIVIK